MHRCFQAKFAIWFLLVLKIITWCEARRSGVFAGAQCAAACIQRFSQLPESKKDSLCTSPECRACLLPCQTRPAGFERCRTLCSSWLAIDSHSWTVCEGSCRRLYSFLDGKSNRDRLPWSLRVNRLELACTEGNEHEMRALLRWDLRSNISTSPVAFIVRVSEGKDQLWASSSFSISLEAVISGLQFSNYRFQVRSVSADGRSALSNEVALRLMKDLRISDFEVAFNQSSAIVTWKANRNVCRYRVALVRMNGTGGDRISWTSVNETSVKFNGLIFGADYRLQLYPSWPDSGTYIFRFQMQKCLDCIQASITPSVPSPDPAIRLLIPPSPDPAIRLLIRKRSGIPRIERSKPTSHSKGQVKQPKMNKNLILGVFLPVGLVVGFFGLLSAYRLIQRKLSVRAAFFVKPQLHDEQGRPDPFETSFDRVDFIEEIGHGEFGVVYRGQWSPSDRVTKIEVAVKKLQSQLSGCEEVKQFLSEIVLMKRIGRHRNVVSLLGCCTRPAYPLCLIMDFCQLGSVREQLLKMEPRPGDAEQTHCLFRIAFDVASGMEYLSQLNFVHRDLACRNVLLSSEWVAKIADFGLSRDVYKTSLYRCSSDQRLPFRWMSPEALSRRVFSSASDVWSYGILLWEILTLGALPYPTLKPDEILASIERGERLSRPKLADKTMYDLMTWCWEYQCKDRPQFYDIREKMEEILNMRHEYLPLGSPQGTASISCGYLKL